MKVYFWTNSSVCYNFRGFAFSPINLNGVLYVILDSDRSSTAICDRSVIRTGVTFKARNFSACVKNLIMNRWLLITRCLTPFSTVFDLYQCTCPCFPWVLLTSTPHNILYKPLAAFPHKHCLNSGQRWKRNESCRNDFHQSSERILAKPGTEPETFFPKVLITSW